MTPLDIPLIKGSPMLPFKQGQLQTLQADSCYHCTQELKISFPCFTLIQVFQQAFKIDINQITIITQEITIVILKIPERSPSVPV
jgi:hypothetical protein